MVKLFFEIANCATGDLDEKQRRRLLEKLKFPTTIAFVGTLLFGSLAVWGTLSAVTGLVSSLGSGAVG